VINTNGMLAYYDKYRKKRGNAGRNLDYFGKKCAKKIRQPASWVFNKQEQEKFFKDFEKKFWKPEPSSYFCSPKRGQLAR